MALSSEPLVRVANRRDGADLAVLIDIAAEGLSSFFWREAVGEAQSPLERGRERALREDAGFSYRHALMVDMDGAVAATMVSYLLLGETPDFSDVPAVIRPLMELEQQAAGYWYVNVLAVYREFRGRGLGTLLLRQADQIGKAAGAAGAALIVASGNEGAERLYRRAGFDEVARKKAVDYPGGRNGQDWILMTKPFS